MESPVDQIAAVIEKEDNFIIASHVSPDGDAVGSMAGMGWILSGLGKKTQISIPDAIPRQYAWVNFPVKPVQTPPDPEKAWTIVLDCGDISRVPHLLRERLVPERTLIIDHHQGNPGFGPYDWIEPHRSSVGEMVAELALRFGLPLDGHLAQALYLAIVTDTGFFTFGNTTRRALEIVGLMFRQGLEPGMTNAAIQNQWTINRLHLQGRVLQDAELHFGGKVNLVTIPANLFEETGATREDCDGLVNFLGRVRGVEVAALLRENGEGKVKFSLRSVGDTDVQRIATLFNGGGHRNASGGLIPDSLEGAKEKLLMAIGESMGYSGE